jgi:dTDP-4-amino-4,6-dideoxy-D-glucose acyltransferase
VSYYSLEELARLNLAACGDNAMISRKASLHNPGNISIADNVRIDDFCLLSAGSGGIAIGSNVHIAAYTSLIGRGRIELSDFANLSSRVSVYSSSDDYSGLSMSNPTIPEEFKQVTHQDVHIGRHVIVGTGTVILPGVRLELGAAVGALSLVKTNVAEFTIVGGVPAKVIAQRSRQLLETELRFLEFRTQQRHPGNS